MRCDNAAVVNAFSLRYSLVWKGAFFLGGGVHSPAPGPQVATVAPVQTRAVNSIRKLANRLFVGNSFACYNNSAQNHVHRLINTGKPLGGQRYRFEQL